MLFVQSILLHIYKVEESSNRQQIAKIFIKEIANENAESGWIPAGSVHLIVQL